MNQEGQGDFYQGREASEVKHLILSRYLEKLAYKVGMWCRTINYVDGFAGPWKSTDEKFSDTSPHIALRELDKVRDGLQHVGRTLRIRCLFIEKDEAAAKALRGSIEHLTNAIVLQGEFLDVLPDILTFTASVDAPAPCFTFLFIDPTGWTGYDLEQMAALLQTRNIEVLINFMTKDIIRFVDNQDQGGSQALAR